MQASEVTQRAARLLLDESNAYWSEPELLGYVTDAQRQLGHLRPDLVAKVDRVPLKYGVLQDLPEDGVLLLDITRNRGFTGIDLGPAITAVDMRDLDAADPNWQQGESRTVQHYMYDPRTPLIFYVYPVVPRAGTVVEGKYAQKCPEVAAGTDELLVPDGYSAALVDYVVYRAQIKDSAAAVPARAQMHLQLFQQALGLSNKVGATVAAGNKDQTGEIV